MRTRRLRSSASWRSEDLQGHRTRLRTISVPLALLLASSLATVLGITAAWAGGLRSGETIETPTPTPTPTPKPRSSVRVERADVAPAHLRHVTAQPGAALRLPPSRLGARIEISLKGLAALVNRSAPGPLVADSGGWQGDRKYRVYRGDIAMKAHADYIEWSVPLRIEAAGRARIGSMVTRTCRAQATIRMRTKLSAGSDWNIKSTTTQAGRSWKKRCKIDIVPGLKLDLTPQLDTQLKKIHRNLARRIDREVPGRLRLRHHARRAWAQLNQTQPLANDLFLQLAPSKVSISELHIGAQQLHVDLEVTAQPKLVWQHRPANIPHKPLPKLQRMSARGGAIDGRIEVIVPLDALRQEASQRLNLPAQSLALQLRGLGSRLEIAVHHKSGGELLRLTGRPRWDRSRGELFLDDVENTALGTAGPWGAASLARHLGSRLRYPVGAELKQARDQLDRQFDLKGSWRGMQWSSQADLSRFAIERIALGPEGLHLSLRIKGRLHLKIK